MRFFYRVNGDAWSRYSASVLNDRVTDLYIGKSSSNGAQTNVKFKMMSLAIWKKSLSASDINDIYIFGLYKIFSLLFIELFNATKEHLWMHHFLSAKDDRISLPEMIGLRNTVYISALVMCYP